jgi:uncharacterized protein (DUF1501 family)
MADPIPHVLTRRALVRGLGLTACSVAAHPWLTSVTLAGTEGGAPLGDHRLVVIILRGAMDGLDLVQPLGDREFARLRPTLGTGAGSHSLTGRFALHAQAGDLMPLWSAGQLAFVHATSTPYRDQRSHFTGQDLLEAGGGSTAGDGLPRDGWLNRMLGVVPGLSAEVAYAIGTEALPLLTGAAPIRSWAPEQSLQLSAQARLLLDHVSHDDPLFRDAMAEAFALTEAGMGPDLSSGPKPARIFADVDALVDFAADRMRADTRIVAFSQTGWDTHRGQANAIARPLSRLTRTILRLAERLGPEIWDKTAVLAVTEFGRTVRENGSGGTDHGTGGVMLAAGGAIKGGQVLGSWPGLAEGDLYDGRDLKPTSDVRAWTALAIKGLYGLDRGVLEGTVFPGLDLDGPGGQFTGLIR